jgi:hypothetical protein
LKRADFFKSPGENVNTDRKAIGFPRCELVQTQLQPNKGHEMTKFVLTALVLAFAVPLHAATVKSEEVLVSLARVTQVVPLVQKPGLQVSVSIEDLGGSTDISPTMAIYFTLYAKGERFDTDATFKIADVLSFKSAKRISGGIYQVVASTYDGGSNGLQETTYTIDAIKAVNAIQSVTCEDEVDCEASSNFASEIDVQSAVTKALNPAN